VRGLAAWPVRSSWASCPARTNPEARVKPTLNQRPRSNSSSKWGVPCRSGCRTQFCGQAVSTFSTTRHGAARPALCSNKRCAFRSSSSPSSGRPAAGRVVHAVLSPKWRVGSYAPTVGPYDLPRTTFGSNLTPSPLEGCTRADGPCSKSRSGALFTPVGHPSICSHEHGP